MNEAAVEKLSRLKVGALFMETGTGKTKIALDLLACKIHKVDCALWICPFSLKEEIENERRKWHPELELDVVGCESIGQSDRVFVETLDKVRNRRTFVIVDESLRIKNSTAKRTQRIIEIGKAAEYKLILNGTPVSRSVADLWAQMEFLSPKILRMSEREFARRYLRESDRRVCGNIRRRVAFGSRNVDNLMGLIEPYVYECRLEILSSKMRHTHSFRMTPTEEERYAELKRDLFFESDCEHGADLRELDFYRISTALQQHYCASENRQKVLDDLIREIDDKVIVFVKFLSSVPEGALAITGDVKDRADVIARFRDSDRGVLYMTYGCGAFGLNLQFCHNVIFLEHGFDYATRVQAEARVYRIGQTENVNYHDIFCEVGLEKMISASMRRKSTLLDEVKREIQHRCPENWVVSLL